MVYVVTGNKRNHFETLRAIGYFKYCLNNFQNILSSASIGKESWDGQSTTLCWTAMSLKGLLNSKRDDSRPCMSEPDLQNLDDNSHLLLSSNDILAKFWSNRVAKASMKNVTALRKKVKKITINVNRQKTLNSKKSKWVWALEKVPSMN